MSRTPFQSILCPVDFSDCSAAALDAAAGLAALASVALTVLHATHVELPSYFTESGAEELRRQLAAARGAAEDELRKWAEARLPAGLAVHFAVDERPAVEAIQFTAAAMKHPWIVMGTHGRTGLQKLLLGSVAERVLRESHVPVVTIPPDAAS